MCAIIGFDSPTLTEQEIRPYFDRTISRGPDMSRMEKAGRGMLGFHRLAIMGLHEEGMQPFHLGGDMAVCNGELYGFRPLKKELEAKGYTFASESDCELILPLYREYGVEMFAKLDAEFAMIIYDAKADRLVAARDPIGIRPLFYGYLADGGIIFASEAKNLVGLCEHIMPFPPGHYYADGKFVRYADLTTVTEYSKDDLDTVCKKIREKLIAGVEKRLDADAPLGFLLSGGLDSSLVCAISAKLLGKRIRTFAIGMDLDPIDLKYAREVADFIGAEHTEVIMTREQVLASLEEVVAMLGTYDITTIRASMGMYLCCKAIHEQTDVRVLMTGEISDELFGYKYTDFAPSPEAFQQEAKKRVDELYMYDVLRADRCIAVNSMEARVPFGDLDFVKYVMSIDPELEGQQLRHGQVPAARGVRRRPHPARGYPLAAEGRLLRRRRSLDGGRSQGIRRKPVHRRGVRGKAEAVFLCDAVHEGKPALPRAVREVLPRAGRDGQGLLDAEQGLGGLRRQGPLRPRALQLRRKRRVSYTESTGRGRPAGRSLFI